VDTPRTKSDQEGKTIVQGIQIDPGLGGRPIGYYIGDDSTGELLIPEVPVSADFVIHVVEPMRAGQYRGLPFCTPVINLLHDLDDLHQYELRAAKDAAIFGPFVKTASGEVDPRMLRMQRVKSKTIAGDETEMTVDKTEYYEDIADGSIKVLQQGDDIVFPSSQRPSVVTQQYWRMIQEQICNGIGIPYVLAYPESLQGTTYRGTLAVAAAMFRARAAVLAEAWQRIYEYVMRYEVATNRDLQPPPSDWYKVTMQPPRAPDVDIGYSSAATLEELAAGLTNYDLVYSARGLDWREEFRKLREQQRFAEELGLRLNGKDAYGTDGQQQQQDGDGEEIGDNQARVR
jgi:capsid protein